VKEAERHLFAATSFAEGAVVCSIIYVLNKARFAAHPELAKAQ
jgi:hypothetical protein